MDEKKPQDTEALKKSLFKNVVGYLRAQAPAIFSKNQDKEQQLQIKRNTDALVQVREEIKNLRAALRKNQQLIQTLQRGVQAGSPQGQPTPTFTPSAVQQNVGKVSMLGGRYLFDKNTRQYTTPQGMPVAAAAVKEQIAGAPEEGGFSGLGMGAAALATTGLGVFLRGKYRTKAIGAGARMMKSIGVPKFARRMVMQGAGRMALGMGARLLANPYALGLAAIAAILLPKEVKDIIGGVLEGFLKGVGLDEDLVDTVMNVYNTITDLSEKFKNLIVDMAKRLYAIAEAFLTPEGRARIQRSLEGLRGTPGPTPGSSSGAEMGGIPGNPPSPEGYPQQPATPKPAEQRAVYDNAKKQLTESKKTLDDKIKTYQRIVDENNFPKTATDDQKNEFKRSIGKLIDLQENVNRELKQPTSPQADYKVEADKLNNLSNAIKDETDKTRILFNRMSQSGEPVQQPLPEGPQPQPDGTPATPKSSPQADGAPVTPGTQELPPQADGAPLSPAQQLELTSQPIQKPGTKPTIGDSSESQPPEMQSRGGRSTIESAAQLQSEPGVKLQEPTSQPRSIDSVMSSPSAGEELNQRSQNIAQMRYAPKTQDVSTNYVDNSQTSNLDDSNASRYIPSPVAARNDLDADIIFNAVA